ncbi:hypothetical protein F1E19_27140, partial [Escherichia coli]
MRRGQWYRLVFQFPIRERVLERSGEAPVYGPNLRASCRRLEDAGWLRTLRAPNLQLAVELTDAGRAVAQ